MKAVICKVGQNPEVINLADKSEAAFEEVRALIGGYVERVRMGKFDVYCDEDGTLKGLPFNRRILGGQPIVGTFIVLAFSPHWMVGLSDSDAEALCKDLPVG